MDAQYKALLLMSIAGAKGKIKEFADKYVSIKSLTYESSQENIVKEMKKMTEKVQGKVVTVSFGGKPDR